MFGIAYFTLTILSQVSVEQTILLFLIYTILSLFVYLLYIHSETLTKYNLFITQQRERLSKKIKLNKRCYSAFQSREEIYRSIN